MTIIARMNVGGPAVQISTVADGLDPSVFDHALLSGWCAPDEADFIETQAPDLDVTRIDGLGRAIKPVDDLFTVPRLARAIRAFNPDVIHTHTAKAGVLGRIAAAIAGTSAYVVHTYHGHLLHGYFSPTKTRGLIQLERLLARSTDRLVTVGSAVRDDLLSVGVGQLSQYVVLPPGVPFAEGPPSECARTSLGLPLDQPVVSMIGRITRIKRPDRFADAVGMVVQSHPEVHFLVAGSGDLEPYLRKRVADENLPVTMLGWRSDVDVLLAATDMVMLTSDNEGTPISLIQAGMAGLPVVATNVGSVHEVVHDHETGLLCATTPHAIASNITKLLEEPAMATALGATARRTMNMRFGVDQLIANHAELYLSLYRLDT